LERLELATVRQIRRAYEESRQVLLAAIRQRQARLAQELAADEQAALSRALARDQALFDQVEERLAFLRGQVDDLTRGAWDDALDEATDRAEQEADVLARGLRVGFGFEMIDFASAEFGLEDALQALDVDQQRVAAALRAELRAGLVRGDPFDEMIERLLAREAGLWANGRVSAERAARRGVIDANNGARDAYYRQWRDEIPGLQKQAVAVVGDTTTETCLHVHGQVQPLDEPYRLQGRKAFRSRMMYPAFHWGCRTSSVAYHADFERGAAMPTSAMQASARAELVRRG
jgi:hypothetical protein